MKLNRSLLISNKPYQVINEKVVLDINSPGRAIFTVASREEIKTNQLISFHIGYASGTHSSRLFLGVIESVILLERQARIFCRELTSALSLVLPISLRHVNARGVLEFIGEKVGLQFSMPDRDYSTSKVANFYNTGSGFHALDSIGSVFNINDYIWQQQGHGVVYAGNWADSRWAEEKRNVQLVSTAFDQQSNNSARIPAVPSLRPGVHLNGKRIQQLQFAGNHMEIAWKK